MSSGYFLYPTLLTNISCYYIGQTAEDMARDAQMKMLVSLQPVKPQKREVQRMEGPLLKVTNTGDNICLSVSVYAVCLAALSLSLSHSVCCAHTHTHTHTHTHMHFLDYLPVCTFLCLFL